MPSETPKITAAEEKFFQSWKKDLSDCLKKKTFPEEKCHLLQSPFDVRLEQIGKKQAQHPYFFWSPDSVVDFTNTRFLKFIKMSKGKHSTYEKALPLVKSFRTGCRNKKGEENTLTILFEKPGDVTICPPDGALVDSVGRDRKYPVSLSEDLRDYLRFKPNPHLQQILSPLGKKGLVAFHTENQYCDLTTIPYGKFQRFFLAPDPVKAIVRVVHTLKSLCNGDPKQTQKATERLKKKLSEELSHFGKRIVDEIENTLEYSYYSNIEQNSVNFSNYSLPNINLGNGYLNINLCADLINGYRFQTSALSLELECPPDRHEEEVNNVWKELTK
jgi:hypothetical protein